MKRSLSASESPSGGSFSTSASIICDSRGPTDPPATESDFARPQTRIDQGAGITAEAIVTQDQGDQGPLSALERLPPMSAGDELSNTQSSMVNQYPIEFLVGSDPHFQGAFGAVQQQELNCSASPRAQPNAQVQELLNTQPLPSREIPDINEKIRNAPASALAAVDSTDQHLPVAQRQLSDIPQSPHLTPSPSRSVTPDASLQKPDSGEIRHEDAKFGVACPENRSTLHEESHPQDTLLGNSPLSDDEEYSSHSKTSYTPALASISGESLKSQSIRPQDGIPIITNRPTLVSMPTTPTKKIITGPKLERVCLNGKAELPSYGGADAPTATPLSPGEVRSPIRGTIRKRQAMDDFPDKMRIHYRRQWGDLCNKPRSERGVIDGYESGDSDLELSEWEDAKERRRKKRKF